MYLSAASVINTEYPMSPYVDDDIKYTIISPTGSMLVWMSVDVSKVNTNNKQQHYGTRGSNGSAARN